MDLLTKEELKEKIKKTLPDVLKLTEYKRRLRKKRDRARRIKSATSSAKSTT